MLDEILAHTAHNRLSQLILISVIVEPTLFFRIGNKSSFDQRRGNIRRLEYRESGLLNIIFVQGIDRTQLTEQILAEFQAVIDRCGL